MGPSRAVGLAFLLAALALAGCITSEGDERLPDDAPIPAVDAQVVHEDFSGRLVCAAGAPIGTWNPCFLADESDNVFTFSTNGPLETLIVGLRWDARTPAGEHLQLLVETVGFNAISHDDEYRYGSASGKSDLVVRIDAADLADTDWAWDDTKGPVEFQFRVFPARTMPPSVFVDQAFEVHVKAFTGVAAPGDAQPFPADS